MAKALTVAILVVAAAVLVAANGKGIQTQPIDLSGLTKSTADISAALVDLAKIHKGDLSGCDCRKDCKDTTQEVCKVTTVDEEKCEAVDKEKEFVECENKCYKADKVIEIGIPMLSLPGGKGGDGLAQPAAADVAVDASKSVDVDVDVKTGGSAAVSAGPNVAVQKDASVAVNGRRLFSTSSGKGDILSVLHGKDDTAAGADKASQGKEICRKVCKPSKRIVKEEECSTVPKKNYDCRNEVIDTKCVTSCKCGDKISVQIKEVPDILGSFTSIYKGKDGAGQTIDNSAIAGKGKGASAGASSTSAAAADASAGASADAGTKVSAGGASAGAVAGGSTGSP